MSVRLFLTRFLFLKVLPLIKFSSDRNRLKSKEAKSRECEGYTAEELSILMILFFLWFVLQRVDVHCHVGE